MKNGFGIHDVFCRAIAMSIVMSWAIGLAFLIVLLVSIQDVDAILDSSLDMPVAQLFWVCL